jgi:hypothetical protein
MKLKYILSLIAFASLVISTNAATLKVELLKDNKVVNEVTQPINDNWQVTSSTTATPYVVNGELLVAKAGTEIKTLVVNNIVSYEIKLSEIVNYTKVKDSDVPVVQGVTFSGATPIAKTVTLVTVSNAKIDAIRFTLN